MLCGVPGATEWTCCFLETTPWPAARCGLRSGEGGVLGGLTLDGMTLDCTERVALAAIHKLLNRPHPQSTLGSPLPTAISTGFALRTPRRLESLPRAISCRSGRARH